MLVEPDKLAYERTAAIVVRGLTLEWGPTPGGQRQSREIEKPGARNIGPGLVADEPHEDVVGELGDLGNEERELVAS